MHSPRFTSHYRQQGITTLFITLVLLGVLTVITLFAASFGVFEQRTSGNEYRYKLAFQAAEAGLNQAAEYMKVNTSTMLSTATGGWLAPGSERWKPCSDPLPAGMALDPCKAEPDSARRAQMYRYVGSAGITNGVLPLTEVLPGGVAQTFTTAGGTANFATTYQIYATLCRQDVTNAVNPACSLAPAKEGTFYVTTVSRGQLTGESGDATIKESFGTFRTLAGAPDSPLIAAGVAIGLGNAQIIPNPDAGGFGVPVSIWSKGNATVASGASFATCQLGEWLGNSGNPAPTATDVLNGVCASCSCNNLCPGYGLLSGAATGCGGTTRYEGEDILDVDGNISDAGIRDSKYFPPDLFAYIFGKPATQSVTYLTANARQITDCSTLGASDAGLIWYTPTTDCKLSGTIGSLQNPVVLVSNGKFDIASNGTVFGILYACATTDCSSAGTGATGATGDLLKATGNPQIYGSVILEGNANMAGSPTIVYNKTVLSNVLNSSQFLRVGPVAGSWSDDVAR